MSDAWMKMEWKASAGDLIVTDRSCRVFVLVRIDRDRQDQGTALEQSRLKDMYRGRKRERDRQLTESRDS